MEGSGGYREVMPEGRVLLLGATGFIGSRLVPLLLRRNVRLRLLVRDLSRASSLIPDGADVELVRGDLVNNQGLMEALKGVGSAYYLVHSMGGKSLFRNTEYAERDRLAAENFMEAARAGELERVIYLGALGDAGEELSEHLESRAEIARILSSGGPSPTILRAAIIIGAGGASFEMLRYLVERLPVMVCPRWIESKVQPIALRDVLAYLEGCLLIPETAGRTFDIGGPDVLSYRQMMEQYAEARGLARRLIFRVPLLTPLLSAYWVDLVTPVPSGIAHPLIEGLRSDVVCRETTIEQYIPLRKTPYKEAVRTAFAEEKDGPGVTGW